MLKNDFRSLVQEVQRFETMCTVSGIEKPYDWLMATDPLSCRDLKRSTIVKKFFSRRSSDIPKKQFTKKAKKMEVKKAYPPETDRLPIKLEKLTREDFFADVDICEKESNCHKLSLRIRNISPTNSPQEKRSQRDEFMDNVHTHLQDRPTGIVNVWYYDDFLRNTDGTETSLTMDLIQRFIQRVCRFCLLHIPGPGHDMARIRIFSPNLKRNVVEHLHSLPLSTGMMVTGTGCVCRFNDRWCGEMRAHGGLDVVMIDTFAGIKHQQSKMVERRWCLVGIDNNAIPVLDRHQRLRLSP